MEIQNRQHGFTLVELIIALLILSIVMALCASGFKFGTRVWNTIDVQAAQIDTIQAVQGFIRASMSNSLVHDRFVEEEDGGKLENLFIGDTTRIKYVSYSPRYGVDDYLYEYDLFLDYDNKRLSLHYRPFNKVENSESANSISTLVEGVEEIKIEYFSGYVDDLDSGSDWSTAWTNEFVLPLLVKINLVLEDKQKHWPELVIQMRNGPYVVR